MSYLSLYVLPTFFVVAICALTRWALAQRDSQSAVVERLCSGPQLCSSHLPGSDLP